MNEKKETMRRPFKRFVQKPNLQIQMMSTWLLVVLVIPAVISNLPPEPQPQPIEPKPLRKICPVCRFVCRKPDCPPGSVETRNALNPCTCDNCPFCAVYKEKGQSCNYTQRFPSNRRKRQTSDMTSTWLLVVLVLPAVIGSCPPDPKPQRVELEPSRMFCPVCLFVCPKVKCPPGSVETQNAPKPCTCDNCPFCAVYREKGQSCNYTQRFPSNRRKRQASDMKSTCLIILLFPIIILGLESKRISEDILRECKVLCIGPKDCPKGQVKVKNPKVDPKSCDNCPYCAEIKDLFESCNYTPGVGSKPKDIPRICGEGLTCVMGREDEGICLRTAWFVCPSPPNSKQDSKDLLLASPDN
ncbi:hypothetical protein LSTR_LSTR004964 [Laodelphax striatellus]|uniref:Uncharacterized protein n=1 Tax=Laodelphax striatellus TaxID=195883 RepID=A0A482XMA4_LAOST|nr:hypothetical protein LSTR_LSTR004964 [Laodelphax striatellus]